MRLAIIFGLLSVFPMFQAKTARAETIIDGNFIYEDTNWTAEKSPYIISEGISLPRGHNLHLGSGVVVKGASALGYQPNISISGNLIVDGTKDDPVRIDGVYGLTINSAETAINHLVLNSPGGLSLVNATGTITGSTITGAERGIYSLNSTLSVEGSRITGNQYGIWSAPKPNIFQVNNGALEIGGLGNVLDGTVALNNISTSTDAPVVNLPITIRNSDLSGNSLAAINNTASGYVDARQNWWGSTEGPVTALGSSVVGQVNYQPWLDHNPLDDLPPPKCCSNVLFIPGLEGTWMYRGTNTLWAPNRNDDVRKLFLNVNGSSTDKQIYSGEPISKVFNIFSVYDSFMHFMDGLKQDKTINDWQSYGYDWRKPITEVVAGHEVKAATTTSLENVVAELASSSQTKKVTIVAHSNGGLVTKALLKSLADKGKAGLIDSVISVAVPYIGTPTAVSALLHGDHQSIAGGLILKARVARELGQNMSSAYSLLPTPEYFSKVATPVISFASSSLVGLNNSLYASVINSFSGLADFITDKWQTRLAPSVGNTSLPIKGNSQLTNSADALHSSLDSYVWPADISRWSLIGSNIETPRGLNYANKEDCLRVFWFKFGCTTVLARSESSTYMGDGTVVAPSAAYDSGQAITLDLDKISRLERSDYSHVNILESSTTQNIIRQLVSSISVSSSSDQVPALGGLVNLAGVKLGEPDYSQEPVRLVVSTDSDTDLSLIDAQGNHTGQIDTPTVVTDDSVIAYENKIPGSHFTSADEKMSVSLPINSGATAIPQTYSVMIRGGSTGSFNLAVDKVRGDQNLGHVEFADIPMTPLTVATTTLTVSSSDTVLGSDKPVVDVLNVDIDGDGSVDLVATSTENIQTNSNAATSTTPFTISGAKQIELLKKVLATLLGDKNPQYKAFAKRLDKILDLAEKGKIKQANKVTKEMIKGLGHKKLCNLSEADRAKIIEQIETIISALE